MTRPAVTDLIPAALEAGVEILRIYAADEMAVTEKADSSPVTEADQAAEAVILAHLKRLAPDVPVVAEEEVAAGRVPDAAPAFFLVDPLDGTKEFINRNGEFTVNIALVENGAPVLGVVYVPAMGEIYFGSVGEGAERAEVESGTLKNRRPIAVRQLPAAGPTVLASRSHRSPETDAFIERVKAAEIVNAGSSLKFCRVAAGDADLYPRLAPTMEWDTAAGDAVLRAAGGITVTLDGAPLAYGKRGRADAKDFLNPWFVASSTALEADLLAG